MLEILSPAGSPEGVMAAVQNGADAVYLGFGDFNARKNAKNFTEEEFAQAAEYCRIRGVKVYVTLNTLASDRELAQIARQAQTASRLGADAVIVQDLGVVKAVRQAAPDLPVHASTQMSIHNLDGVRMAAAMGISRVVLARELSLPEIAEICREAPIEIEVFAHGALCMSYSGQCYMSAVIGRRSGNRGLCAQPCRLKYLAGPKGSDHPLSLKDNCLAMHLQALEKCGVACIKIEGRMRRPEYTAIVTGIYSRAVREKRCPSAEELDALERAFSRQGFTDGYLTGRTGPQMFGVREEENKENAVMFATARKNYLNGEFQRIPVQFIGMVRAGKTAKLAAQDDRGNVVVTEGLVPQRALTRALTAAAFRTQLHKTGGTPFYCAGVKCEIDPGLSLPTAAINEMRRALLVQLLEKRKALPSRREGEYTPPPTVDNLAEPPVLTVSIMAARQLSPELAALKPAVVYIPAEVFPKGMKYIQPFLDDPEMTVAVIVPRIIHDNERDKMDRLLGFARSCGVTQALVGNLGHLGLAAKHGFELRGDFGLNIYNSDSLAIAGALGLKSVTVSFELRLSQIRSLYKCVDTEAIVYGRLPLMVTENCIIHNGTGMHACRNFSGLKDRRGASFPVVRTFGCRNLILNSKKLFLADKGGDYTAAGLWGARLMFTTESAFECVQVAKCYLGLEDYAPAGLTRGLYYRGVE
jgi:putative protease